MSKQAKEVAEEVTKGIPNDNEEKCKGLVAVIPAGGLGGQMYPVTSGMPKALLPLNDRPLLVEILKSFNRSVFKRVIILCNEWHQMIQSYMVAFRSEISIEFECRKTEKLPPESLKELSNLNRLSEPFLFHYCDIWLRDVDWKYVFNEYKRLIDMQRNVFALVLGSRCYDYSVGVMTFDRFKRVTSFVQKPEDIIHGFANCAVALLTKGFVRDYINCNEVDIFNRNGAIQRALVEKKVFGCEIGDWHHFQQIRDWLKAQKEYYTHIPF